MNRRVTSFLRIAYAAALVLMVTSTARAQFPRTVLMEEFTNLTCKPCTTATPIMNALIKQHGGRVVSVRYHPNLPLSGDPYYDANPSENSARADYYGVVALPHGRADGNTAVTVTDENEVQDITDERLGTEAPVKLEVSQVRNGNQVTVNVTVTTGPSGVSAGDYRLRVAVIEEHIHNDAYVGNPRYNGETEFYEVFRKMLPNTEGETVTFDGWITKNYQFAYTIDPSWQPGEMAAVAFLQNDDSKAIMQAAAAPAEVSDAPIGIPATPEYQVHSVFPNPAVGMDQVELPYAVSTPAHVTVSLYTATGRLVKTFDEGFRGNGDYRAALDMKGLPAGNYVCRLRAGAYTGSTKFTLVR